MATEFSEFKTNKNETNSKCEDDDDGIKNPYIGDEIENRVMKRNRLDDWRRKYGIKHEGIRCFLAEMFGTFILVVLIQGSVAQKVLTEKTVSFDILANGSVMGTLQLPVEGLNVYLSVQLAHFVALAFAIYVSGGVSGGHINPAVTLAMSLIGRLRWSLVPFYMAGQFLGAFLACPIVYGVFYRGIELKGNGAMGVWATGPYEFTTLGMAVGSQIFGTFILVTVIMSVTDARNMNPSSGLVPLVVGLALMGVGLCFGTNSGFSLNPARDFGPRIFESFLFAGKTFERGGNAPYYFWVPILMPFVGSVLGAAVYILLIELHHPELNKK